jgi:hypothetical protein
MAAAFKPFSRRNLFRYTGDGGKGKSIAILPLQATGLAKDQGYIPTVAQSELVFKNFTARTNTEFDEEVPQSTQSTRKEREGLISLCGLCVKFLMGNTKAPVTTS